TAVIMNPHTGEILAMANEPTFNPNAYRESDGDDRRNRAVQDLYEPGSTFKVVTVSAALEEKVMSPTSLINTSPGRVHIGPRVIRAVYRDGRRYAVRPKALRRTISPDTAAALTSIMEGVVSDKHGTARAARIDGYTIAGKTGTAAKLVNGHYSHSEYNASFV